MDVGKKDMECPKSEALRRDSDQPDPNPFTVGDSSLLEDYCNDSQIHYLTKR